MRYLLLCAGMGKRLGAAAGGQPKALVDIAGETLLARLLRQIRASDPGAEVHAVLGFRSELVAPHLPGCRVVLNPFFDITGINASLWFARESFDSALFVIHGDLVLSDALAGRLFGSSESDLVCLDSSILDPREINVKAEGGRVTRFGVNYAGYSGAYSGVLRLSESTARRFAQILGERVGRGFNDRRTYYFFVMRRLIAEGVPFRAFDFAGRAWREIDYEADLEAARRLFGPEREAGEAADGAVVPGPGTGP